MSLSSVTGRLFSFVCFLIFWLCWVLAAARGIFRCSACSVVCTGLVTPGMRDLGSLTGDQTHIPCIARQFLNHWTTREVSDWPFCNSPLWIHCQRRWSLSFPWSRTKGMLFCFFIHQPLCLLSSPPPVLPNVVTLRTEKLGPDLAPCSWLTFPAPTWAFWRILFYFCKDLFVAALALHCCPGFL